MSEQATTGALKEPPVGTEGGALEPPKGTNPTTGGRGGNPVLKWLSPVRIGAVYVWIAIIVMFCIWKPSEFATWDTVKTILNQNTVPGIVALALVVPLSTQVFDLSVGYVLGLGTALLAYLLADTSIPLSLCLIITIAAGFMVGLINATIIVRGRIDSFIGTLATGSIIGAVIVLVTSDQDISGLRLAGPIATLSSANIGGVELPVFIMLGIVLVLWWLMSSTVTGRRLYATGFNEEAARLTGVPTKRLRFYGLILSAVVATISGIVLLSQIQSASPDIGPPYLLDAYAAVFLGATQIHPGRFNVWGTVIGVLLVGTGQAGLGQVGAPTWSGDMFEGIVLLLALSITNLERTAGARSWIMRRRRAAKSTAAPSNPAAAT